MDEHYIPTFVHMLHGEMSANRSLTWVDWSRAGPHPARFIWPDVTDEFLNRIRFTDKCPYYVLSYGMGYIRPGHLGPRVESCQIRVLGSSSGLGSDRVLSGPDPSVPRNLDSYRYYNFSGRFRVGSCQIRVGSGL
ncbi:hypothetical protein F2Q69_00044754 [Brassica cretica]|uniref:Uncharacterized protein n=1 Tax=Brassica cretica TaxID=69181 RepID=A0A8S9NJV8_BRACR|nr:hypothetical protein F2Q69_00044754 [Brassica cretica]